jgi:hypothetical protein
MHGRLVYPDLGVYVSCAVLAVLFAGRVAMRRFTFSNQNALFIMCIKNPKRFLFWKYLGDCQYRIVRFGKFMKISRSSLFVVRYECELCGRQYTDNFVSEDTLLENGVSVETIIENRNKEF